MAESLSGRTVLKVLDWAYEQAIDGVSGVDSASDLAQEYMVRDGTLVERVNSLIRW